MHPLIDELLKNAPIALDGAWGTQLQARGLPVGACPDAWNLDQPQHVESVARAYVEAGSRIILTNTFGANRFVLERHGLAAKAAEINRAGAEISRKAAAENAVVFASIGPSGKMLMMGEVTEEALTEAFEEQAAALREGGAQALVVETMADIDEAVIAGTAAKKTGLPVVVSMVYGAGAGKDRTIMGVTPEQAAARLSEAGVDVIGANCGQGIQGFIAICQRLKAACDLPLWMKANAGLPELDGEKVVYRSTPQDFAAHVPALVEAGASFVGGCCGTSPDYIKAMREVF